MLLATVPRASTADEKASTELSGGKLAPTAASVSIAPMTSSHGCQIMSNHFTIAQHWEATCLTLQTSPAQSQHFAWNAAEVQSA